MSEQQTTDERRSDRVEREVIVTDRGGSSGPSALIAIVAIVVLLVIGWFAFQAFTGSDGDAGPDFPSEVNVDVNPGGGGEG